MKDLDVIDMLSVTLFVIAVAVGVLMSGCASAPPANPIKACVINVEDNMCWYEKDLGQGTPYVHLDGYFGVSKEDMLAIGYRLNECADK